MEMVYTPEERAQIELEMDTYLAERDSSMSYEAWSYRKHVAAILLHRVEDLYSLYEQHAPAAEITAMVNIIFTLKMSATGTG